MWSRILFPTVLPAAQGCCCLVVQRRILQVSASLEQLLTELDAFLKILDQESLSSTAVVKKSGLAELLRCYTKSSNSDEEYIYMNKVTVNKPPNAKSQDKAPEEQNPLTNGEPNQQSSAPQKGLPDLPAPKVIPEQKQLSIPKTESPEGYYEEAEPYDTSLNGHSGRFIPTGIPRWVQVPEGVIYATITLEDGEIVSSSYESYDEEEGCKGKPAPYQWPSPEAGIELMRDARICAFLWRKKWLGQWAKQLCVIKDTRLLCYKSSKDHSPQLDVNLLGSSVIHKEKQVRKKEHKLKITPMNADVIVLGLQSKDQAEQWLRVIQEVSGLPSEGTSEGNQYTPEAQRLNCQKPDLTEKYLSASDCGSSIDGHPEVPEAKDVKKKSSAGLKLSNLMNLGRKKSTSLEPAEKSLETSSYLNVLVNSQWKSRWCSIRDSHLHIYQDRNRSKVAQQPLSLVGCEVVPDPSPDHLYSFRILHKGEELLKLEAKSSEEMGHWLGLLLSESGSQTDPEDFIYDYVDAERVSCIVSAAKTSLLLMQRKFSEPNTYIDGLPSQDHQEMLYDDVAMSELTAMAESPEEAAPVTDAPSETDSDRVYLDLTPVQSILQGPSAAQTQDPSTTPPPLGPPAETIPADPGPAPEEPLVESPENPGLQMPQEGLEPEEASLRMTVKVQDEQQKVSFPPSCPDSVAITPAEAVTPTEAITPAGASPPTKDRLRAITADIRLGKNRTEAEVRRYTEEKERLEKKKEETRGHLAQLRREKRELREALLRCTDKGVLANLEQKLKEMEEECRMEESRRVDLELNIMEVKDNLKKAEAGPVTLGTTVDTTHLENVSPRPRAATPSPDCTPVNSATALKSRPLSVMVTGKGSVLQKAKEWEKKGTS
ncbi:actin filament-associated protein 1-like 2 isoform X5 [Manis javanica]|uniref:actin filament-associated protein 1-like 2 isoform X5 n=2 Tax=Manis javanica TaxID=9974 RepID=UPI003C6DA7C5